MVIVFILSFIAIIFLLYLVFTHYITKSRLLNAFKRCNVLVYGPRGYGKDVLFQYVIKERKKPYLSNLNYGYNFNEISVKDLEIPPNNYHNFINNDITIVNKKDFENKDIYLSDLGILLPSQYDNKLHNIYPSFSVVYALSRHLYNNNIHGNTQALERPWKAIREQADYYVKLHKKCIKIFGYIICRVITYDKYQSAKDSLLPMKKKLFNKENNALVEQYNATHGEIKIGFIFVPKKIIKYDSRAYHEKIFGYKAPTN